MQKIEEQATQALADTLLGTKQTQLTAFIPSIIVACGSGGPEGTEKTGGPFAVIQA
jgi:hypothetical protein